MKNLILLLLFILPTMMLSQLFGPVYQPPQLNDSMYNKASLSKPIDTVRLGTHRYIYRVKGDTNLIHWDLIRRERIYYNYWTAAFDTYFLAHHASMLVLPGLKIPTDKYLHGIVGYAIGAGTNILVYRKTKRKWLAFTAAAVVAGAVGVGKELLDTKIGGVSSKSDALATLIGGVDGSLGVVIVFGHKERSKKFDNVR